MALPIFYPFKTKYYSLATTTTSGTPICSVVVGARCIYQSGYYVPNIQGTGANVEGFDVIAFLGSATTGAAITGTVITSGTVVNTSTGNRATFFSPSTGANAATGGNVYLNAGDVISVIGTTLQAGFITHIVQEF